jgi:hypothetical protein
MTDDYVHPLSINGQLMKKDARIAELEAENEKLRATVYGQSQTIDGLSRAALEKKDG